MNHDFQRHFPLEDSTSLNALSLTLYVQAGMQTDPLVQTFQDVHAPLERVCLDWITHHDLWQVHGFEFPPHQVPWNFDWLFCDNATIEEVNLELRGKKAPTDVLSFPTLENASLGDDHAEDDPPWPIQSELPDALKRALLQQGGHLGTVMVSLDYAQHNRGEETLFDYVLERFIHGSLHVLGVHHATQADYEDVLRLQADFKLRFQHVLK
jgi:rRNA maturation RNase YbeY